MKQLYLLEDYKPLLDLKETEIAIKYVKDNFEKLLAKNLNLTRVSAPLFVYPETGLNDLLNGYERVVSFDVKDINRNVEIVQSLAKWKRNALMRYNFSQETGLYTDMNAIRRDEELDSFHSIYVDQWDWEKIISKEERKQSYLKKTVKLIYKTLLQTEKKVCNEFSQIKPILPSEISFISTKKLEEMYPELTPKERENKICREYGAVFLYQIGWPLKNKQPHDGRAADYDDWKLNGDILVYYPLLDCSLELSSMGIRVDELSIIKQLKYKKEEFKLSNPYVQDILNKRLPYTIGGGIGQSRLCMFFLRKAHIGEVQASVWNNEDLNKLSKHNIYLL